MHAMGSIGINDNRRIMLLNGRTIFQKNTSF
jgi:hypothetical protein